MLGNFWFNVYIPELGISTSFNSSSSILFPLLSFITRENWDPLVPLILIFLISPLAFINARGF